MKKRNERKKGKTANSKRTNKKKNKKAVKSSKNNSRKKSTKPANKARSKHAGTNKRRFKNNLNSLSQKEREIYRSFETLLEIDEAQEKIAGSKVTKKRDDNLFIIPLRQKGFKNKIAALQNANFSVIEKFLNKQKIEALYAFVTLKIKKPDDVGYYFNGEKSQADMVVNAENSKTFAINVLINYYNYMEELIEKQYDEQTKVYNVIELSIRFLFPTR